MSKKASAFGLKKIILLTIVLLIAITFSGCSKKEESSQTNELTKAPVMKDDSMEDADEDGGIINSIKEALISDKILECTFTSNEDDINAEVKSYIQGKKYKTEFIIEGKKNNSIFDGKVSYSWEEGAAQGIKINTDCLESFDDDSDIVEEVESDDESAMEVFDGAQNVECHEVGNADFSIPEDVNFLDQCEMLKKQQDLIKDLDGQIPVGMPQF